MTPNTTTTTTNHAMRVLLLLAAALTIVLGMSLASPAAAFVDNGEDDDETSQAQVEEQDEADRDDDLGDDTEGNGFVNDTEEREAAPVGGVDAGFGGAAGADSGLGSIHVVAVTLLALAILAHTATARRTAHVRA